MAYLTRKFIQNTGKDDQDKRIIAILMAEVKQENKTARRLILRLHEIDQIFKALTRERKNILDESHRSYIDQVNKDHKKILKRERRKILEKGKRIGTPRDYLRRTLDKKKPLCRGILTGSFIPGNPDASGLLPLQRAEQR